MGINMKKYIIIIALLLSPSYSLAQTYSPYGRSFGFGIMVGDPLGATLKIRSQSNNAFVIDVGSSYFGSPRVGVDYLWQFNSFRNQVVNLYAGPGGIIGFGEGNGFWYRGRYIRASGNVGLAARGVVGVNFLPRDTPIETFVEIGVLISLAPDFDSGVDAGLGIRFYP
jgi:hypothetical protein